MGNISQNLNNIYNNLKETKNQKKEYKIFNNNKSYIIKIFLLNNNILIKCENFQKLLILEESEKIFKFQFNTINNIFNYITNKFNSNKVFIKNSSNIDELILIFKIFDDKLKKELEIQLNLLSNKNNNFYKKDPNNIHFLKKLSTISYNCYSVDNSFTVFKSINELTYLIYSNENVSIICYCLNNEQIITEIANAHCQEYITNINHCYDRKNKKDIIMSVSGDNNNIKLWDFSNWKCILNINNINKIGFLESACILNIEKDNFVISSNWNYEDVENIKVFDFKGNKIKEIINSNEKTYYINTFYELEQTTYYLIAGNFNYMKSYNYHKNKLYHKYYENNNYGAHLSAVIYKNKDITELIESCVDGYIRIWNFHLPKLLNKINTTSNNFKGIFGICLWNEKYLFTACNDNVIKLIDLENNIIAKKLEGHKKIITCVKKIIHPKYGECLISQGYKNDQLYLWVI